MRISFNFGVFLFFESVEVHHIFKCGSQIVWSTSFVDLIAMVRNAVFEFVKAFYRHILLLVITQVLIYQFSHRTFSLERNTVVCVDRHRETNVIALLPDPDEITYSVVPKPIRSRLDLLRHKIAMSALLASSPKARLIVFIDKTDFEPTGRLMTQLEQLYGPNRIRFYGELRKCHKNIPFIDDWIIESFGICYTKFLCLINADILLCRNWFPTVKNVYRVLSDKSVFIVGERIDFFFEGDDETKVSLHPSKVLREIDQLVSRSLHNHYSPLGNDYFVFDREKDQFDPSLFPPFKMGHYSWDPTLSCHVQRTATSVSFNTNVPVYHLSHVQNNFTLEDPKVRYNEFISQMVECFRYCDTIDWIVISGNRLYDRQSVYISLG
jgi:hypothetical protein